MPRCASSADEALKRQAHGLESIRTLAQTLGSDYDALAAEASLLESAIRSLADNGVGALDPRMVELSDRLSVVQEGARETARQMAIAGEVATAVGDLLAAAFGGEIGPLAAAKAKENAILAAEQTVHGIVASLNPFTAPKAAAHFAAAGKFAAIATAWAALGASTGGFSAAGGGASAGGAAGAGTGQRTAARTAAPGDEIHIHFVGPGFDAVNPQVQRIIRQTIATEQTRRGNAVVRIHRSNRS